MKKVLALSLILISASFIFAQNNTFPNVKVKNEKGDYVSTAEIFEDAEGPIIIDFWATWCKPCIKELKAFDEKYEDWQDQYNVTIYAVSIDDSRDMHKVMPMVNSKGWEFKILMDPNGDFKRAMGVTDVPHTFIYNKEGELQNQHTSYMEGDEEEIADDLQKIIDAEKE